MAGQILYGQESRERILAGIEKTADAVRMTFGPKGRNVLIGQASGLPSMVGSGTQVAEAIEPEDRYERIGARIMKEAAAPLREQAGDGTTAAMLFTAGILKKALKNIAAGANAVELRKGIQGSVQLSCAAIRKLSRPVQGPEDIRKVAAVSSGSESAGELTAKAFGRIGAEGVITVEESPNLETSLEITEGMQYEKGYLNLELIQDQKTRSEELKNPYILVTDYEISNVQDILPLLEQIHAKGRPLLVIAENVTAGALSALILNKKKGVVNAVAVHPPAYGDGRQQQMEDICIFTGGTWISRQIGLTLRETTLDMLGTAEKVTVSKNHTAIVNGGGDPADVQAHLAMLRRMIQTESYDFKNQKLRERLARFTGGTAVIRVGAPTDTEMKEFKGRMEQAVQAAKAALQEGVVPGGGTTYLDIVPAVRAYADSLDGDQKTGASIVLKALEMPLRQIAENAGLEPSVVAAKVKALKRGGGYDVRGDTYTDMMKAGIVDPAKVTRLALQCAASAAAALMTAEAGVTAIPKTAKEP